MAVLIYASTIVAGLLVGSAVAQDLQASAIATVLMLALMSATYWYIVRDLRAAFRLQRRRDSSMAAGQPQGNRPWTGAPAPGERGR